MSNVFNGGFLHITATGVSTATSGTSAGGALPVTSSGVLPRFVRIAASQPACVRIGVGAQTAVTTDMQVQPGDAVIVAVSGATHYAAIQVAAAGVVQISPLENC